MVVLLQLMDVSRFLAFTYFKSPTSGILGMHSIQQRPVAVNGIVIRPMMYVALSYDVRAIDERKR